MSAEAVAAYFRELKLEQHVPAIIENDVNEAMLQDLIAHDGLDELGITSKLHQAKIRSHISSMASTEVQSSLAPSGAKSNHERFTDDAVLNGSPVAGFAELEMCSFQEAAERLPIADVPGVTQQCAALVEARVASGKLSSSLDSNKSKALALYTHSDPIHESDSYYAKVNRALRKEDRAGITPYMRMLKLTVAAMTTIEPYSGVLWRGVKADLVEMYPKGKRITWWSFSSCTVTLSVLERDLYLSFHISKGTAIPDLRSALVCVWRERGDRCVCLCVCASGSARGHCHGVTREVRPPCPVFRTRDNKKREWHV